MNIGSTTAKLTIACAVVMCAALAAAQGGGGGRGQGRGGFGQGGGMDATGLQLLGRADVQRDLALTDDQKAKVQALRESMRGQGGRGGGGGGFGGGGGGGGNIDREAMRAEMEKRNAETKAKIAEILKPEQVTRLGEIAVQLAGNRAILNPDVQKTLGLSDEQKAKITELQTKMQEANRGLFQQVQDGSMTREQIGEAMQKNNETMNAELGKVLTTEQAAKLKAMGGKEFKADPPQRPPF
jgi:hypothetical protein